MDIRECIEKYQFIHPDIGDLNNILQTNYYVISIPRCGTTAITEGLRNLGRKVVHAHINESTYRNITNGHILRANGLGLEHFIRYRIMAGAERIWVFSGLETQCLGTLACYSSIQSE